MEKRVPMEIFSILKLKVFKQNVYYIYYTYSYIYIYIKSYKLIIIIIRKLQRKEKNRRYQFVDR